MEERKERDDLGQSAGWEKVEIRRYISQSPNRKQMIHAKERLKRV